MSKNYISRIEIISKSAFSEKRVEIAPSMINAKSIKKANTLLAKLLPKKLNSEFDNLQKEICNSTDYAKIWFCRMILYILQGKIDQPFYLAENWEHEVDLDTACCNLLKKK